MAEKYVFPARRSWSLLFGRGLVHNPEKILNGLIKEGDSVVDIGCGPGFFTPTLSLMAGASGKVFAVDLQQEMLDKAKIRVDKMKWHNNVTYIKYGQESLNLPVGLDFALAFYMVHEVPDTGKFFIEVAESLKPGGRLLVVEPKMHVSKEEYAKEEPAAAKAGLKKTAEPKVAFSYSMLLVKQ